MAGGPNGQYYLVGLDVHKATICVAVTESGRGGEVRQIGVFKNRPEVLRALVFPETEEISMKIDGECLCGNVAYEAEIDPQKVIICHCTDCQTHSASAYRYGAMVRADDFRLTRGALKHFDKTAESGARRRLSFCPECGTSIHGTSVDAPVVYSLRLGTARQRAELTPVMQIWRRSAQKWVEDLNSIVSFDEQPRLEG